MRMLYCSIPPTGIALHQAVIRSELCFSLEETRVCLHHTHTVTMMTTRTKSIPRPVPKPRPKLSILNLEPAVKNIRNTFKGRTHHATSLEFSHQVLSG
ncbi:hypothetical protein Bpfe_000841 [Biomphalaria pfeifferi]|uniref:Uncharacterized protein n=1 Tax=Biomphalaria pfeifferi TaxID=112525 RepID=A0AAD8FP26_BIOPF|nr:hypothetical protein Bpfe_000841 [Biomphalaria pfeifferi]